MHAEVLLVVKDVVEGQRGTDGTAVVASAVGVASILSLVRVKKIHGLPLSALHCETRGEFQFRQECDGCLSSGNEFVVVGAVVL